MKCYYVDASAAAPADLANLRDALNDGRAICNPGPHDAVFLVYIENSESITDLFDFPANCQVRLIQ